ncbi:STAS domain-containing protein [Streptomyces sp. NPDC096193]|uniref:STAS domain-containing protein n=1 Tax=Streptomyces sp. NPDC096193 TaxID=3155821 RepID=UPI0033261B50
MASPSSGYGDRAPDRQGSGPACDGRLAVTVAMGESGRSRVVVVGEIDLEEAPALRVALDSALDAATGLDLDLTRVSFCDCSCLRVLMEVHYAALASGRTVAVTEASGCVWRLLDLTGTGELLAAAGSGPLTGAGDQEGGV